MIVFLLAVLKVCANGDPVMSYSAICRVANPEPQTISDISIVDEVVNISHEGLYCCYDITYKLYNNSAKDYPSIDYGFPIDYEESESGLWGFEDSYETESVYERGWHPRYVKDVGFAVDGRPLDWQEALESVRAPEYDTGYDTLTTGEIDSVCYGYMPEVKRRWYYSRFGVSRGDTITLNVRYKVRSMVDYLLYMPMPNRYFMVKGDDNLEDILTAIPFVRRFFTNQFSIYYDFKKAKHFGDGIIKALKVNIDLSDLDTPVVMNTEAPEWEYQTSKLSFEQWYMEADNIKPIQLRVSYRSGQSDAERRKVAESCAIPSEAYSVTTRDVANLVIQLDKPRFVSEVAANLDTVRVKRFVMELRFADGRTSRHTYEFQPDNRLRDNGIALPGQPEFLPVVDSYVSRYNDKGKQFDEMGDLDDDYFKLSSVKLHFPDIPKKSKTLPYDNVMLLDSRWMR